MGRLMYLAAGTLSGVALSENKELVLCLPFFLLAFPRLFALYSAGLLPSVQQAQQEANNVRAVDHMVLGLRPRLLPAVVHT